MTQSVNLLRRGEVNLAYFVEYITEDVPRLQSVDRAAKDRGDHVTTFDPITRAFQSAEMREQTGASLAVGAHRLILVDEGSQGIARHRVVEAISGWTL